MNDKITHFTQSQFELESFREILVAIFPQIHFIEPNKRTLPHSILQSQTAICTPFKLSNKNFGIYIFECDSIRAKVGIHTELKSILKATGLDAILAIFHTPDSLHNAKEPHPKSLPQGEGLAFDSTSLARSDSKSSPSLAEGVRGWVDSHTSSLQASEASVAIQTESSSQDLPSTSRSNLQNKSIDCHEDSTNPLAMTKKAEFAKEFRLSLITSGYDFELNKPTYSNLKRQSFILGHTKTATAQKALQTLIDKAQKSPITQKDLEEAFSQEPVSKEFYAKIIAQYFEILQHATFPTHASDYDRRSFVLRLLCRILFCKFLEKKSIIDSAIWDSALSANYYHEVLEPLFFTTLNTPKDSRDYGFLPEQITSLLNAIPYLNGGLFSPQDNDFFSTQNPHAHLHDLHIPNQDFSKLFALLDMYNFTLDEQSHNDEEVALDPELLGTVFESLLSQLFTDNKLEKLDKNTLRKATGSYYTPREIVRYMVRSAILSHLQTTLKDKVDSQFLENLVFDSSLRDLPSANRGNPKSCHTDTIFCHTELSQESEVSQSTKEIFRSTQNDNRDISAFSKPQYDKKIDSPSLAEGARGWVNPKDSALILQELSTLKILDPACGSGAFPMGILSEIIRIQSDLGDTRPPYTRKLEILQNCIYGVDIQPMATEIARLRCFLSLIIDEDFSHSKEPNPLPNLEFKFISANALLPLKTSLQDSRGRQLGSDIYEKGLIELQQIRTETFTSHDKIALQSKYKATIDKIAKDLFFEAQGEMPLTKWNPFNPNDIAQFFDSAYMFGVESFDIVIGNPPYIRQESIPNKQAILSAFADFACSTADIYTYFFAKALDLLAPQGILTYIVSNKFARAGYGKNLRSLLLRHTIESYTDFNGIKIFENAIVDSCILQVSKSAPQNSQIRYAKDLSSKNCDCIPQDSLNAEAFIFVDSHTLALKQKIEKIGTPLKEWDIEIYRGVLTGYNEAFIIDTATKEAILDSCDNSIKSPLPCGGGLGVGLTERERTEQIIKPILRGRDIKRYSYEWANLWLIGTFPALNLNIDDYPALKKYLENFMPRIAQSGEKGCRKKTSNKWFETQDNIAYYGDFEKPKLIWAELARTGNSFVIDTNRFSVLAGVFLMTAESNNLNVLKYLNAVLNNPIALFYLEQVYSKLDTTGWQWKKAPVEKIPIPKITKEKQKIADEIVNLVDKILESKSQGKDSTQLQSQIDDLVYKLYALDSNEIEIIKS
ncbi:Eco57I restriction-modification methylase domain-containing protein [Helicobacter sp. T3_23-1056]